MELAGDLAKLAASWPAVGAFTRVHRVLELRELWAEHLRARNPNVSLCGVVCVCEREREGEREGEGEGSPGWRPLTSWSVRRSCS